MGFKTSLMRWYRLEKRALPWRETKDPYKIWISEVILQQTRVDQGLEYYLRFIRTFPDVKKLAKAREEMVLKAWQGLGYYSRARNLHRASKQIVEQFNGVFPDSYEQVLGLQGIGPYSAAAILSIAFNKVYPVIDGNVLRVVGRYLALETDVLQKEGRKKIEDFLNRVIDQKDPGDFNQAVMELGALVCKPLNPDCPVCPLRSTCKARKTKDPTAYPLRVKRTLVQQRFFHYLVVMETSTAMLYIRKRLGNDIWRNLYDFPMIEAKQTLTVPALKKTSEWKSLLGKGTQKVREVSPVIKHKLSHRELNVVFVQVDIDRPLADLKGMKRIPRKDMGKYPFPILLVNYLNASGLLGP